MDVAHVEDVDEFPLVILFEGKRNRPGSGQHRRSEPSDDEMAAFQGKAEVREAELGNMGSQGAPRQDMYGNEAIFQSIIDHMKVPYSREEICDRLRRVGIRTRIELSLSDDRLTCVGAGTTQSEYERMAEVLQYPVPVRYEFGGGRLPFARARREIHDVQTNGELFSDADKLNLLCGFAAADAAVVGGAGLNLTEHVMEPLSEVIRVGGWHETKVKEELNVLWRKGRPCPKPSKTFINYYGNHIASYFSFLSQYTRWLFVPALLSIPTFVLQTNGDEETSYAAAVANAVFGILMAIWGTVFLEFVKREQNALAFLWGSMEKNTMVEERTSFRGEYRSDGDGIVYKYFSNKTAAFWQLFSGITVLLCIGIVVAAVISIIVLHNSHFQTLPYPFDVVLGPLLNVVVIVVLDMLYQHIARWLTKLENHRTDVEHENALILKTVLFMFVNHFASLFYLAFAAGSWFPLPPGVDRIERLRYQLGIMFLLKQGFNNIIEFGTPKIKRWLNLRRVMSSGGKEEREEMSADESRKRKEVMLEQHPGTFYDYAELVIQFGYVTMFANAFPLVTVVALVNNVVEIQSDFFKLQGGYMRPRPRHTAGIGAWSLCLEAVSFVSVFTNCAIVFFVSDTAKVLWPSSNDLSILVTMFTIEHAIVILKVLMRVGIADVPGRVLQSLAVLQRRRQRLLNPANVQTIAKKAEWTNLLRHCK